MLGHRKRSTTAIYAHLDDNALQDAAAQTARVIAEAMGYKAEPLPEGTDDAVDGRQAQSASCEPAPAAPGPQRPEVQEADVIARLRRWDWLGGNRSEPANEAGSKERSKPTPPRGLVKFYDVQNRDKSLFDAIEYDSEVEKRFAHDLDNNENVKVFVKLPGWFRIDTPIGPYNPDWAFVTEREEKLYFVRETKHTLDAEERRTQENQRIACGRKHFGALGVDYDVVTSLSEVSM